MVDQRPLPAIDTIRVMRSFVPSRQIVVAMQDRRAREKRWAFLLELLGW